MTTAIFPSINSWITPRTQDVELTSDNCEIILNQKIESINKIVINGKSATVGLIVRPKDADSSLPSQRLVTKFSNLSTTADGKNCLQEMDITRFVVEKQKYMTLPVFNADTTLFYSTTLYKNNTYYFEHNTNKIVALNTKYKGNAAWIKQSVTRCLLRSIAQYYIENGGLWASGRKVVSADSKEADDTENPIKIQFRVYYTPLGESVKLQVPKTNPQVNQFCIPYSQQQPIVDNTTLGREMQSIANRAGCETKEVVRTCHSFAELRRPKRWNIKQKQQANCSSRYNEVLHSNAKIKGRITPPSSIRQPAAPTLPRVVPNAPFW